jgi:hypothetical protein
MSDDILTEFLVIRGMGWRICPDRYVKTGREWLPRWRFQPLTDDADALQLLDRNAETYKLEKGADDRFRASVRIEGRLGKASDLLRSRAIAVAVARALGITTEAKG